MNKKLIYIVVVFVVGLFVISACEQTVGRKVVNKKVNDDVINHPDADLLGSSIPISCRCDDDGNGCGGTLSDGDADSGWVADCSCCEDVVSAD